jgi:hypothetical protein
MEASEILGKHDRLVRKESLITETLKGLKRPSR